MHAATPTDPIPPPRRLGLFGGTFDPVHHGHLHLATLARDALALDEVRFIPCRISPHKSSGATASAEERVDMLRLAIAPLPWAVVDDLELRRPGPSYSHETATAVAARHPEARLFWIMGGDQWEALPRWNQPERLAELVDFIVLARGVPPAPRPGFRMHAVAGNHPASATAIRRALAETSENAAATVSAWLAAEVANFIASRGLYRR